MVSPGLPGESVEPGGRRPDGGGICPGHPGEILLFHGDSLPNDVPGGSHRGFCVQPAADDLPDATEHPPGGESHVPHPAGYSSPEPGQLPVFGRVRGAGGDQRGAEPGRGLPDAKGQRPGGVDSRSVPRHPYPPLNGAGLRQRAGGR